MKPSRNELEEMAGILRESGWSAIPPERHLSDLDSHFLGLWDRVNSSTMISPERGWALAEAIRYVCRSGIPGDIAECGVWKGGACLLASLVLHEEEVATPRRIWLYDTFSGMVTPGEDDRIAASGQALSERNPEGWWAAGIEEVKSTLRDSPLPESTFEFVPGRVEETLRNQIPGQLAVLRLDTDWYESTKMEMEVLFPLLSPGGVLIIDDYGHFTGARKAIDEYFASQGMTVLMHRSDYTGRVILKDRRPSDDGMQG